MKLKSISALTLAGILSLGFVASIQADDMNPKDAREQLMKSMGGALGGLMKGAATDKVAAVQVLVDGFPKIPGLFPEGSGEGTDALPNIWTDNAGFLALVEKASGAAGEALTAAQAGDDAALMDKLKAVAGVCGECHEIYRAKS